MTGYGVEAPSPAAAPDPFVCLGQMAWVASHAASFAAHALGPRLIHWRMALECGQYRIFYAESGSPVAFVTWATLDEAVEDRLLALFGESSEAIDPGMAFTLADLSSGDRLWILDLVAPFGHARQVVAILKSTDLARHSGFRALRVDRNGRNRRLAVLNRLNATDDAARSAQRIPRGPIPAGG